MDINEFEGLFKPAKHYINLVIIGLCVVLYFADELVNHIYGVPVIKALGFLEGRSVVISGQYWRVFSYMFLHGSLDHLLNNMLILYFMGNYVERMLKSSKFLLIYLASGVFAASGSLMINGLDSASVGASGAIFGVFGAVLFMVLADKLFDGRFRKLDTHMTLRQIMVFVVLSVYSGFSSTGVDNAAHVAGLVAGFLITALIYAFMKPINNYSRGYF